MSREVPLVLVADDDALSVLVLQELLTRAGYMTVTCSSAHEAYILACQERPDLVLLDVQMEQRYSGLMTLQKLRETPATIAIPVILCSADSYALDTLGRYVQTYNYPHEHVARHAQRGF
jgi:CheY-like chemotaxis protein